MAKGRPTRFITTRWSVVISAGAQSRDALGELCKQYWGPLHAYVRTRDPEEANDLTQGFFTRLLEKNDLSRVDPGRGRFRSWLRASMDHYRANQWAHDKTQRRGGDARIVPLDADQTVQPCHGITPERLYEQRWANHLVGRVMDRVRAEQVKLGNGALFERVQGFLVCDPPDATYAELAAEFDDKPTNLRARVSHLGRRFRELLRAEVADTVESPDEVDDELRHLVECLGPPA